MTRWSMRMRRQSEKRLFRALKARKNDFERDGRVLLDLWEREAFIYAQGRSGHRYSITVSTAFVCAGFRIWITDLDAEEGCFPHDRIIRQPEDVMVYVQELLDEVLGDPEPQ